MMIFFVGHGAKGDEKLEGESAEDRGPNVV